MQGRFSLTIPASRARGQTASIAARRIGFQAKLATITLTGADLVLGNIATPMELTGVVVTALSQQRGGPPRYGATSDFV
jgi:hypothetical protein